MLVMLLSLSSNNQDYNITAQILSFPTIYRVRALALIHYGFLL